MKTKKKTTRKPAKKKAFDVKNYKANGMNAGLVLGGLIGAHVVDSTLEKVTAIKNEKIKKAIPLAIGVIALGLSDKRIASVGSGMAAFGAVSLARNVLGLSGSSAGVNGISEGTKAMISKLLPNLGSTDYPMVYAGGYNQPISFEPVTIDTAHTELSGVSENPYAEYADLSGSMDADSYFNA
jgi:hypothetical protein